MDELSVQIRAYYDATTPPTDLGPLVDVSADERSGASIPTNGVDHEGDAWSDIHVLPLGRSDHLGLVTQSTHRPIPTRRWLWMVAAITLTALVGAIAVMNRGDGQRSVAGDGLTPHGDSSTEPPEISATSPPPNGRDVTRRFLMSYGSWPWNLSDALALTADGAELAGLTGRTGTERDLASYTTWLEAIGYTQTLGRCGITHSSAEAILYRCPFDFQALGSDALGLGPYTGSYYDVTVSDGKVASASVNWNLDDFSPEVWEPFADWVAAEYPGDLTAMYTDDDLAEAKTTEEAIALWRTLVRQHSTLQTGMRPPPPSTSSAPDYEPGDYLVSRHPMTVDGVAFSFSVLAPGWGAPYEGFLLSKDTHGSQGAEAVIFWSGFPDGDKADPCRNIDWHDESLGWDPSQIDLVASVVASAPGVDLRSGPTDDTIDGRPAKHVELTVRARAGCDPGYFYNWKAQTGGAMWVSSQPGDTIDVWVVNVDGTTLFIGGETHPDTAHPDLSLGVAQEIQQIVDSIRFE